MILESLAVTLTPAIFIMLHIGLIIIGLFSTVHCFLAGVRDFGFAFTFFTLAEILYLSHHTQVLPMPLAHFFAEVFIGLAFVWIFGNRIFPWQTGVSSGSSSESSSDSDSSSEESPSERPF